MTKKIKRNSEAERSVPALVNAYVMQVYGLTESELKTLRQLKLALAGCGNLALQDYISSALQSITDPDRVNAMLAESELQESLAQAGIDRPALYAALLGALNSGERTIDDLVRAVTKPAKGGAP